MVEKFLKFSAIFLLIMGSFLSFSNPVEASTSEFVTKGNTSGKQVALTFDDGSDGTNITKILQTLSNENIHSTFFLTGSGTKDHPNSIKDIKAAGHELANHSYSHADFTKLSSAEIKSELDRTEAAVKSATGLSTKPLFRAPFGSVNSSVLTAVGNAGYTHTIHWNIDTLDWKGLSETEVYNRVIDNIVPGSIVLMHTGAGASGTPGALPDIIRSLKAKGYQFVTVSEILNMPSASGTIHTVKAGDTLYSLAGKYGVTVNQIVKENNLSNANVIRVGQRLVIPGDTPDPPPVQGDSYTVKAGDTLYSIAKRYNVSLNDLIEANQISNSSYIRIGQNLVIPQDMTSYTVKAGDTLYSIARRNGTTVQRLAEVNNISNTSLIYPGRTLLFP
ncbi:polysaccharide deacetylase family sporulation protein PdaB [Halobacillus alkaliphilus]|uniref:Polysaccharide deacetylase family sporulation protein PdaB n=1 Tax=Halobacillus alkaliphilus TaxID=396056 RepID=A0A1I2TI36_9BACI|nr:LysM peptidoglycan-binding domain-containing protein [Halobacillus alkaliphilus]SFG64574.1 polysaccharide deacetylase family sporulation protein PdaB [Halobacillus alkaliphilus]